MARPTLVMDAHYVASGASFLTANLQINIIPTIVNFPSAFSQLQYFERFTCSKLSFQFLPLTVVNTGDVS